MNVWAELIRLCEEMPALESPRQSPKVRQTALRRLKALLKSLPEEDESITAARAAAVYYEAIGDLPAALEACRLYRDRLERLHHSIETSDMPPHIRQAVLAGCDATALQRCQMTIQRLEAIR